MCVHVCLHVQYGHRVVCGRVCSREIPEKNEKCGDECTKKRQRWCTVDVNTSDVQEDNHSVVLQSV